MTNSNNNPTEQLSFIPPEATIPVVESHQADHAAQIAALVDSRPAIDYPDRTSEAARDQGWGAPVTASETDHDEQTVGSLHPTAQEAIAQAREAAEAARRTAQILPNDKYGEVLPLDTKAKLTTDYIKSRENKGR